MSARDHFPVIPPSYSTERCGNYPERWVERRRIILRQRDVVLHRIGTMDGVIATAPWCRFGLQRYVRGLESNLRTLNRRIDECNEAMESLAHVRIQPRRRAAARGGV